MKPSAFKIAISILSAGMLTSTATAERESFAHTAVPGTLSTYADAHASKYKGTPSYSLPTPFLDAPSIEQFDAALTFVRSTGLNKNLSLILLESMKHDSLVVNAIKNKGLKQVQNIIVHAIISERIHFESDWDQILANTYSQFFTANELISLARDKSQSPYFSRLVELQGEIAQRINTDGVNILSAAKRSIKSRVAADLVA